MELKALSEKIIKNLTKYKYPICILLVGLVLMLIPTSVKEKEFHAVSQSVSESTKMTDEDRLSSLLSNIQGAGMVEVLLSYREGEQTIYHEDAQTDADSDQRTAVIVTDSDRNESALVSRVDPPRFLGAIVVCQGADSATVRLAIVEAVSKYTGLGADQIAVLKMK